MITEYTGLETAISQTQIEAHRNVPSGAEIEVYYKNADLNQLLDPSTGAVGIRFHFDDQTDANQLNLLAIGVSDDTLEIATPNGKHYLRGIHRGETESKSFPEAEVSAIVAGPKVNRMDVCVYFSRLDIERLVAQPGVIGIRLIGSSIHLENERGGRQEFITLTAVGFGGSFNAPTEVGEYLKSPLPCPPNCGGGYGGGNF